MNRRVSWSFPLVLGAALAISPLRAVPLAAQAQATTGIVRGAIVDSTGAPVVGVIVSLRNTATNFERTLQTNDRGTFVATLLPLGVYTMTARALGYAEGQRPGIVVRLGESVDLRMTLQPRAVELATVSVTGEAPIVDVTQTEAATRLSREAIEGLPNNGRNYLNLTLLTPNVAIVQGPDGDELSVGGQRGIHNNVSVDGADFNNPFFGEQRGGQRPAFTFNLDAVQEMVVIANGANAEFGRSSGGFVNVITKSGTNALGGSVHYHGKSDALSSDFARGGGNPDFRQHQFGFTLGGPIKKDRVFFFMAYDQQIFDQTKQTNPLRFGDARLRAWMDTAFGGGLRGDYGAISRTNDANALMAKLDWRVSAQHQASLKYNYANSKQVNGTFDVDTWGRSANAVEKDYSHAVNGFLGSQFGNSVSNEFRFQLAREDRPRPYGGPRMSNGRPFPDTGMDFGAGYRFGMPFFIPIEAYDTRIQVLDNISWSQGNHLWKAGVEWNRTQETQTFIGFANGRFIFNSVDGFFSYLADPRYVQCTDAAGNIVASGVAITCPAGSSIGGPLLLYLQFAPVPPYTSAEQAGTQEIPQNELAVFLQDTWKPQPNLTVNYGVRWEAQIEPDPITAPSQVFFAPFIGRARGGQRFPSDGTIPSDWTMFQPRLGIAWDVDGDGKQVVRGSAGLYYARIPSLILASTRTSNGSVGQTIFRASFFNGFGVRPPKYDTLVSTAGVLPDHPGVFVTDEGFRNPRTFAASAGYEFEIAEGWAPSITYSYSRTDFLSRFINRNDAVFGAPWRTGLPARAGAPTGPADTLNGIDVLTVLESSAKSRYQGITAGLKGRAGRSFDMQVNYTLSWDKSDDDNERDPFSFRYARADALDKEYGYSDRDQRHRINAWLLARAPWELVFNNRVSYYSAQPTSERCVSNQPSGQRAAGPGDRICANGTVLQRNTLRKENELFSWDVRISRAFRMGSGGALEAIVEIFNVTNTDNFRDPAATSLLFNFDGTIRSGLGDPRQVQAGMRWVF